MQTAALYIRVSTPDQAEEGASLAAQQSRMAAWAEANGFIVGAVYVEPGETATDDRRPQFQRMLDDALSQDHPFDAILVFTFSRFSRNQLQFEFHYRRLIKRKVQVISITQPISGDSSGNMFRKFINMLDEYSSEQNSIHVKKSMIQNAIEGHFNGSKPPFGYTSFETDLPSRSGKKRKLLPSPAEADTVRLIFELATTGKDGEVFGLKRIATYLNDSGRMYRGKPWRVQAVYMILTNSVYFGDYVFNKNDTKNKETRPKDEWVITKVPAIISKEEFEAASAALGARAPKVTSSKGYLSPTLLSGIAKCARCGKNMVLASGKGGHYDYYRCSTRSYQGNLRCDGPNVPREELERIVLTTVAEKVLNVDRVMATLQDMNAKLREMQAPDHHRELELQRQSALAIEQLNRWFALIESGGVELGTTLNERIAALQRKRDALTSEIAQIQQKHRLPIKKFGQAHVEAFVEGIKEVVLSPKDGLTKSYLRILLREVRVGAATSQLIGGNFELASAVSRWRKGTDISVPRLVSEWRGRRESNPGLPAKSRLLCL